MNAAARWLARAADRRSTVDIVSPLRQGAARRRRYPPDQRPRRSATGSGPPLTRPRMRRPASLVTDLQRHGHDLITTTPEEVESHLLRRYAWISGRFAAGQGTDRLLPCAGGESASADPSE